MQNKANNQKIFSRFNVTKSKSISSVSPVKYEEYIQIVKILSLFKSIESLLNIRLFKNQVAVILLVQSIPFKARTS